MKLVCLSLAFLVLTIGLTVAALAGEATMIAPLSEDAQNQTLPVTTPSTAAARYFENGMVHYENHRWNLALNDWHEAVRLDPNFALAYTWICLTTADPTEEKDDRALAKATMKDASLGEQLMVRWMAGIHENNYVEGISAMNDLLAMYPHDKRLNFLIAYWLYRQDEYDLSEKLALKALAEDPNYATAYNQMAYLYSRRAEYDKALQAAAKYVALLPNEPNPHDSYGEMLRLSGRFDQALEQYRLALKMDPTFYISQKELGETYAIMGDGPKARAEYAKAIHDAPGNGVKAEYLQKSAMTWVRDKQYEQADDAYLDAAEKAHVMQQWIWEARAYRIMGMYEPDHASAMKHLQQAEAVLASKAGIVAQSDVDEEQARIWRVRAERAVAVGDLATAQKSVDQLAKMASSGGSVSIDRTYQGAEGTLLLAQKKYLDAVPHLEEDFANPVSMKLLVAAYQNVPVKRRSPKDKDKDNYKEKATALSNKLAAWKIPSIEEALVVPGFRAQETPVASQK